MGWERHLVCESRKGNAVAFELLADLHRATVYRHAVRLLRNSDDAEDVTQDTFVKAYRALAGFDERRAILPWLLRICTNCCVDVVRERKRSCESLDAHEYVLADTRVDVEVDVVNRADARDMRAAIDALPQRYRDVLVMRHEQQMAVTEIAERTGAPEGTVKSWLFRARALLAKQLSLDPELASQPV